MKNKKGLIIVIYLIIIMIIMGIPGSYIPRPSSFLSLFSPDKIVHLSLFGPLGFMLVSYFYRPSRREGKAMALSLVFGILYATLTELMQYFVFIGRNGNVYDGIADTLGLIGGTILYWPYLRHRRKTQ